VLEELRINYERIRRSPYQEDVARLSLLTTYTLVLVLAPFTVHGDRRHAPKDEWNYECFNAKHVTVPSRYLASEPTGHRAQSQGPRRSAPVGSEARYRDGTVTCLALKMATATLDTIPPASSPSSSRAGRSMTLYHSTTTRSSTTRCSASVLFVPI
jgi:hypothetical protein